MDRHESPMGRGLPLGQWFFLWMVLVAVVSLGSTLAVVLISQQHDLESRLVDRGRAAARAALYGRWNHGSGAILVTTVPELVAAEVRLESGELVWQYGPFSEIKRGGPDGGLLKLIELVTPPVENGGPRREAELVLSTKGIRLQVFRTGLRLASTLLVVLASAVIVGAFIVNRNVEPLKTLADQVAVFDPENPGKPPEIGGLGREVRDLGRSFAKMSHRLVAQRRALTSSEQRYRGLFESSPVGILELDAYGKIIGANPASKDLLGHYPAGKRISTFVADWGDHVGSAPGSVDGDVLEVTWRRPDGEEAEVELHIQTVLKGGEATSLVVIRDLSDRLRRLGERWQKTLDEMTEGVALLDSAGAPLQENRAFTIFSDAVLARLNELGTSGKRREWSQSIDGRELQCMVAPITDTGEMVLVVRDETDWLRAEERLREGQKMEAVATLAGGVAHDFNNLLAGILLYVRLLERKSDDSEEAVATIRTLAEEGTEVVKGLLDFARPESTPHTSVDLGLLIREQEGLFRKMIPSGVALAVESAGSYAFVKASPSALRRVVMNLVLNARDALEGGPGRIEVSVSGDSGQVVLVVADDGPGVPPSIRDRIFEPFLSLRRDGRGAGLGLAVAYALVREHGGDLEYDPPQSGGALFRVTLPRFPEGTEESDAEVSV